MKLTPQIQDYLTDLAERLHKPEKEVIQTAIFLFSQDHNAFVKCPKCGDMWLKDELPEDDIINFKCWCGNEFKWIQYPDTQESRELIGKRIKELRDTCNISQLQLAEKIGLKQSNIARIESGKYSTGQDILSKIAAALGKKLDIV